MVFDIERANWKAITQKNVLGPFAPKSGWLANRPSRHKEPMKMKDVAIKKRASELKDKEITINPSIKMVMQKFLKQCMVNQKTKREPEINKRKKDYYTEKLCDIFNGTKVSLDRQYRNK